MTKDERKFQKEVNAAAKRAIESMKDDLEALEHAQTCDGTLENGKPCKKGSETRHLKCPDGEKIKINLHENPDAWHSEENARRTIEEAPLGIEVRGNWRSVGDEEAGKPSEYRILLGMGGPASQIVGDLDGHGQPITAVFQYQNWFKWFNLKPWTDARVTPEESEIMVEWAQIFYFGE